MSSGRVSFSWTISFSPTQYYLAPVKLLGPSELLGPQKLSFFGDFFGFHEIATGFIARLAQKKGKTSFSTALPVLP